MSTPTDIEANKELVRTYTQTVFNEHNTDRAPDFMAPEVKWHGGTLGTVEGLDNVAALLRGFINALPDLRATEQDIVAEGDTVAVRYVAGIPRRVTFWVSRRLADEFAGKQSTCIEYQTARSWRNGPLTTCSPYSPTWGCTHRHGCRGGEQESTMRAIAIEAYGGPERLQVMELPIPQIGPDDVLIRVRAAGVNPADISFREGRHAQSTPRSFPAIVGSDFAGTVAQVGEHVTTVRVDAQVYGTAWDGGSYAEYLRVPAAGEFAARPSSLDAVQAAALPMAGMTALGAIDTAAFTAGEVLLLVGGAGGIGSFATQLAARQGVHVIATGRAEDQQYLRRLGASETVDYIKGDVVEAVRAAHPGGVDAVLDVVTRDPAALAHLTQALRAGGRLLSTVYAVDPSQPFERGISAVNLVRPQGAELLDRLSRMVEARSLWVPVQETLPLEEAARAQELQQHGHVRGKLVLTVA